MTGSRPPLPRWAVLGLLVLVATAAPAAELDPLALELGASRTAVDRALAALEVRALRWGPDALLVEGPMLPGVFLPQRVLLRFAGGELAEVRLRVEPDPGARADEVRRLWRDLRAALARRLGPPTWEVDESSRPDLLIDWAGTDAEVVTQWDLESRSVRAGIPPAVSGELGVEVVITSTAIPRGDQAWGGDDW